MKNVIRLMLIIIATFIISTLIFSYIILNSGKILHNFDFIKVNNLGATYYLYFEKVKSAEEYDVIVYDTYGVSIEHNTVTEPNATLNLENLEYNSKYKITVIAYDNKGNSLEINEPYTFTWTEPSFSTENNLVLDQEIDSLLLIDGTIENDEYELRIKKDGKKLKQEKLTTTEITVSKDLYLNEQTILTYEILENNQVISSINLYSLISPVQEITITSPKLNSVLAYDDIILTYEGGENATDYLLQIYEEGKVIKETIIHKKTCILSSEIFDKATSYKIIVKALYEGYEDYSKSSEVIFTLNEKETNNPVYIEYNPKNIIAGTKVELKTPSEDAEIYYTTDGTDPKENGIKYTEALSIDKDVTVRTIVKADKKNDSIEKKFEFHVGKKEQYKIYLSPSNQNNNVGVSTVGYTNEMKEMNKVTDYIEERLENAGVIVYRNESWGNINRWVADSNYLQVDAHIAIHSNASLDHTGNGIETWVDDGNSNAYSLAHVIQNNLFNLYYDQEDKEANRGVKYANGALGEVNNLYLNFGILIEVAYHDYELDAKWIVENRKEIGYSIADSILKYYQIK